MYDLEGIYDEQISPLMTRIIDICREYGMPMVASFAYRRDDNGEYDLCTTAIDTHDRGPYVNAVRYILEPR